MLAAVAGPFVLAALLPTLAGRLGARVHLVGAVVPAATFGWLLTQVPAVGAGARPEAHLRWVPDLHLVMALRLSPLALLMALLVTGVGTLVFCYARWYHAHDGDGFGRSAGALLAFAGAMLGLVLADDLLTLFVFWELTTVFSFLLIGGSGRTSPARRAAARALLVTTAGGLAMLAGLVLLGEAAGTYRISGIVADPPAADGPVVAALALVLVGAASKSALAPFSSWLPAAMVAPTPVSAYLHAAAMVKAGVFLVATLTPAFATVPGWRIPAVALGAATMVVGGVRALAATDLKRLLAFGTVSQLGFLVALVGFGTRTAALAGAAMILAHALFKATLFMIVGVVDHRAGTRDLRALSGVGRRAPLLTAAALLAAGSMAGLPPFVGFLGKEAAFEAFWHDSGLAPLAVLVVGAALTTGYTLRLLWGAFATKDGVPPTPLAPASPMFTAPALLLAAAGLALGLAPAAVDALAAGYADAYAPSPDGRYHLALWHGPGAALALSAGALAGGCALFAGARALEARLGAGAGWRAPWPRGSRPGSRSGGEGPGAAAVDRLAMAVAARTQIGSLPVYLGVIMLVVLAVPGAALLAGGSWPTEVHAWDYAIQLPLATIVLCCAFGAARARSRLTAALLLGGVGYGIGGLFVVDGAPDLALAQFLVESLSLIAFVFVLRRMPTRFSTADRPRVLRWPRILVALAVGTLVAVFAVATTAAQTEPSKVSAEYIARSPAQTGATNVVNAIIIDFRALDTLGEISVLAVAALGVASLLIARGPSAAADAAAFRAHDGGVPRRRAEPASAVAGSVADEPPPADLLSAGTVTEPRPAAGGETEPAGAGRPSPGASRDAGPVRGSVLLEVTTRALFPVVLVFSLYLLFAGHTRTGGGFSGGLVAGVAFVLRDVAGGRPPGGRRGGRGRPGGVGR
ncbi:DUF4040 domain-containing protein, partial [Frankia sp. CNm7]|uniref:hydrogen gas-evolving membrane-bound hydrogenase subunit E n=1 Tax=Frankia nepalensis TaxID=1836974 RepID=UPI001932CCEF